MNEQPKTNQLIYRELFQDRPFVVLFVVNVLLVVTNVVRVLLGIKEYDIDIPVRYTQFDSIDTYISGDWYTHYEFVIFAIVTLLVNTFLALRIYRHQRWVSLGLMVLQIVLMVFLFVVSGAIINTLPVVI